MCVCVCVGGGAKILLYTVYMKARQIFVRSKF